MGAVRQRVARVDGDIALLQTLLVLGLDAQEMLLEQWDKAVGQRPYAVLRPLAVAHDDSAPLELEIPSVHTGQALKRWLISISPRPGTAPRVGTCPKLKTQV